MQTSRDQQGSDPTNAEGLRNAPIRQQDEFNRDEGINNHSVTYKELKRNASDATCALFGINTIPVPFEDELEKRARKSHLISSAKDIMDETEKTVSRIEKCCNVLEPSLSNFDRNRFNSLMQDLENCAKNLLRNAEDPEHGEQAKMRTLLSSFKTVVGNILSFFSSLEYTEYETKPFRALPPSCSSPSNTDFPIEPLDLNVIVEEMPEELEERPILPSTEAVLTDHLEPELNRIVANANDNTEQQEGPGEDLPKTPIALSVQEEDLDDAALMSPQTKPQKKRGRPAKAEKRGGKRGNGNRRRSGGASASTAGEVQKPTDEEDNGDDEVPETGDSAAISLQLTPIKKGSGHRGRGNASVQRGMTAPSQSRKRPNNDAEESSKQAKKGKRDDAKATGEEQVPRKRFTKCQEEVLEVGKKIFVYCSLMSGGKQSDPQLTAEQKESAAGFAKIVPEEIAANEYFLGVGQVMPDHNNFRNLDEYAERIMGVRPEVDKRPDWHNKNYKFSRLLEERLTGTTYLDGRTATGEEVLQLSDNSVAGGINRLFDPTKEAEFPDPKGNQTVEEELKFIKEKCGYQGGERLQERHGLRLPTKVIHVETREQLHSAHFHDQVTRSDVAVLRNVDKAIGFNQNLFNVKDVLAKSSSSVIECVGQVPQRADTNVDLSNGKKTMERMDPTVVSTHGDYSRYYTALQEIANQAYLQLANGEMDQDSYNAFEKELLAVPLEYEGEQTDEFRAFFGTNVDLDMKRFEMLVKEIQKFVSFLQPDGENDLSRLCEEKMAGINVMQMYMKLAGSRTYAHLENSGLSSFNMNLGPGACVWISVPVEYAKKIKDEREKKFHIAGMFWMHEEDLVKMNVPYHKIVQRPGDIVYVGPGSFHWVTSMGFATNISWNMAQPLKSQLWLMALLHDHYTIHKRVVLFPIFQTVWALVHEKRFIDDPEMFPFVRIIAMRLLLISALEVKFVSKELLNKKNVSIEQESEGSDALQKVLRCFKCEKVVGNTLILESNKKQNKILPYCLMHGYVLKSKIRVVFRSKLEVLVKAFNDYRPLQQQPAIGPVDDSGQGPSTSFFSNYSQHQLLPSFAAKPKKMTPELSTSQNGTSDNGNGNANNINLPKNVDFLYNAPENSPIRPHVIELVYTEIEGELKKMEVAYHQQREQHELIPQAMEVMSDSMEKVKNLLQLGKVSISYDITALEEVISSVHKFLKGNIGNAASPAAQIFLSGLCVEVERFKKQILEAKVHCCKEQQTEKVNPEPTERHQLPNSNAENISARPPKRPRCESPIEDVEFPADAIAQADSMMKNHRLMGHAVSMLHKVSRDEDGIHEVMEQVQDIESHRNNLRSTYCKTFDELVSESESTEWRSLLKDVKRICDKMKKEGEQIIKTSESASEDEKKQEISSFLKKINNWQTELKELAKLIKSSIEEIIGKIHTNSR